jgi:hypothetical protein
VLEPILLILCHFARSTAANCAAIGRASPTALPTIASLVSSMLALGDDEVL